MATARTQGAHEAWHVRRNRHEVAFLDTDRRMRVLHLYDPPNNLMAQHTRWSEHVVAPPVSLDVSAAQAAVAYLKQRAARHGLRLQDLLHDEIAGPMIHGCPQARRTSPHDATGP